MPFLHDGFVQDLATPATPATPAARAGAGATTKSLPRPRVGMPAGVARGAPAPPADAAVWRLMAGDVDAGADLPGPVPRQLGAGLAAATPAGMRLIAALDSLDSQAHLAEGAVRELRGGAEVGAVAASVVSALRLAAPALEVFAAARARQAASDRLPWEDPCEEEVTLLALTAPGELAVNALSRAALQVEQRAATTPAAAAAGAARLALAEAATRAGWATPQTLADADARRYAANACPVDGRVERPENCKYDPVERERQQRRLGDAVRRALTAFGAACAPHRAKLERILGQRAAQRAFVIDLFAEGIGMALTAAAPVAGKAGAVAIKAAAKGGAGALKRHAPGEPEARSVHLLDELLAGMRAALEDVDQASDGLDDHELLAALAQVKLLTTDYFRLRLDPLIAAYREQVEPLGTDVDRLGSADRRVAPGVYRAAWIRLGGRARLAQVADDEAALTGTAILLGQTEPRHSYTFLRWIDPALAGLVGEAPTIDASEVDQLRLGDLIEGAAR